MLLNLNYFPLKILLFLDNKKNEPLHDVRIPGHTEKSEAF
jgi:hypothetical protein